MIVYLSIALLLTLIYVLIILYYLIGWTFAKPFLPQQTRPRTKVTIIIPARNEEKNIGSCLSHIAAQQFPKELMEIIVVDDFSDDRTVEIVKSFSEAPMKLIQMKEHTSENEKRVSYKKKAIETAIRSAAGELIVTTDADCTMNSSWLATMIEFYESTQCHMIVAPVLISEEKNFLEKFQSLDFISLIGITGATLQLKFPTMCNGANLAFRKKSFEEVNGYKGYDNVASGDDLFLMHKMAKQWPDGVRYLKNNEATVFTRAQPTMKEFLQQRLRWASKSFQYADKKITINLALAFLFNLSILTTLIMNIVIGIPTVLLMLFFFQLAMKIIFDFAFLSEVTNFFRRRYLLSVFLPSELLHVLYVVYVGIAGTFFNSKWKGRTIK